MIWPLLLLKHPCLFLIHSTTLVFPEASNRSSPQVLCICCSQKPTWCHSFIFLRPLLKYPFVREAFHDHTKITLALIPITPKLLTLLFFSLHFPLSNIIWLDSLKVGGFCSGVLGVHIPLWKEGFFYFYQCYNPNS